MKKLLFLLIALLISGITYGQVSVTATAGTVGPTTYATVNAAFTAVNAGTHQGVITISITGNTTEPATSVPLLKSASPSSYTSIMIKPTGGDWTINSAATPTASKGVIELSGADNVTIDGDPLNTGSRHLSIVVATNSSTGTAAIRLSSNDATGLDGANNNTVKNCVITGGRSSATSTTVSYGIAMSNSSLITTGAYSSINTIIQNNLITRCYYGIYANGVSSSYPNTGTQILNNTLGSSTAASNIGLRGIYLTYSSITAGATSAIISGNDIRVGDVSVSGSGYGATIAGIEVGTVNAGAIIRSNYIHDVMQPSTTGYGAYGISITGSASNDNINIYNNFIRDIVGSKYTATTTSSFENYGIYISAGATLIKINYNTIALLQVNTTGSTSNTTSACITSTVSGVTISEFRNNILVNNNSSTQAWGFYTAATSNISSGTVNYNDYYTPSGSTGYYNATNYSTLALWSGATGKDGNSISLLPGFQSATNLHINTSATAIDGKGTPVSGITTDYDGDTRDASTPDIGADEYSSTMTFVSATTTQASTATIYAGTNSNPIIGLQVVTSGSGSPLSLTQLSMVSTGTNPTADISKIHVYYTGTSSTFATTTAFDGTGTNVAAGTIVINGSQALANGINYFWIAYDVSPTATTGNTVDAALLASPTTSIVVGGTGRTVTVNDPAGSRAIAATCIAPTVQPTLLSLSTSGITTVNGSFTASSPVADMYLIVRSTSASLGATPVDNINYTPGSSVIGTGTVIAYQSGTSFSSTGLTSGTTYYYFVFAANACPSGPLYLATSPLTAYFAAAANQPIPIANFTADVVINGAGVGTSSTTADCDGSNYCFVTNDFNPAGTVCTGSTYLLWPVAGGTITGTATPAINYTLQPAAGNNVFQVDSSGTRTLNLTTPVMANNLYLLYVSGATPTTMPLVKVNFSDGSNQQYTSLSVINWCSSTGSPASARYYRQNRTLGCSFEACPYFQQWSLAIDPANQAKMITSITFNNASGKLNVFALSGAVINISAPCSGTPAPGNTTIVSGNNPTCSGASFTLGFQNANMGTGLTYDWQSSDDGTFTGVHLTDAIGGASTLTTSQTSATYYRCIATCSGNSGTSNALQITMNTVPNNVASVTPTPGGGQVSVAWATPTGCYNDVLVVASPAANTGGIPTGSGYSGASLTYGSGTAFGNGYIVYEGTASPQVITGLTNGTTYYFKVFTRYGSNWSSGVEVSSTPVLAYCSTLYTTGCSSSDYIDNISVADLAQTVTGCTGGLTYANYTGTIVHFTANTTYPWTITSAMTGEYVGFWIDLNDNGSFGDAGEYVGGNATSSTLTTISGNITIPAGAANGNHRMRVRLVYGTLQSLSTSCTSYTYGETHDYTCNIPATGACSGTPTAGTAGTTPQSLCSGATATMTVSGYTTGLTGITFQWQQSTNGTTNWVTVLGGSGATTTSYTTAALNSTLYYRCAVTCSNSSLTAYTNNVVVNVTTPTISSTTPGSRCGSGSVTLGANGTGTLNWYAASSGGATLGTGSTFTTPSISANTNYYVAASSGGSTSYVSKTTYEAASSATTLTTYGQDFTVTSSFTLNSVQVFSSTGTSITITLFGNTGTTQLYTSGAVAVTAGSSPTIPLGWSISPGTYRIVANGMTGNFYRDNTGVTYPFALGSIGTMNGFVSSITGSVLTTSSYYFMYNWSISTGCESARTPVLATINPIPTITPNATIIACTGSNTYNLSYAASTGSPDQYTIDYDVNAENAGFTDVTFTSFSSSPISLSLPAGITPGNYNATITVKNSAFTCIGTATSFSFTVTVFPNITIQPSTSPQTVCQYATANYLALSASNATSYQWYSNVNPSNVGGTIINGATSSSYLPSTSNAGTLYYYCVVSNTSSCTVSSDVSGAVNVAAAPTTPGAITSNTPQCNGSGITFTSGLCTAGNCYWVSSATGVETDNMTSTNPTYTTAITAGTYHVWIRAFDGSCWSLPATSTGLINPTSVGGILSGGNTPLCYGVSIGTLTVSSYTGTITRWEKQVNSGGWTTISNTGTTYSEIPSSVGTWEYRAVAQSGVCPEAYSNPVSIVVNPLPDPVLVATAGTYCTNTILTASGGTGGTIYWENSTSNGISTTTPSTSELVSASGTYYFRAQTDLGCWGVQGSAAVTINVAPSISTQPISKIYCAGGSTTFGVIATGTPTLNYQWQYFDGTSWANVANGTPTGATYSNSTAATMTVAGVTAAGVYEYQCIVTNLCGTATTNPANLTVHLNPTVVVSPTSALYCGSTPIALTANGANTYAWTPTTGLSASTGVTVNATPASPVIYTVTGTDGNGCSNTATANITAGPSPSAVTINPATASICPGGTQALVANGGTIGSTGSGVVGTGSGTATSYDNPFYSLWSHSQQQILILASELTAAGVPAGNITSLSMTINSGTTIMPDFSLSIANTSLTAMSSIVTSGFTTVYTNSAGLTPVIGVNTITFSAPFVWNGTSNIILKYCWGNSGSTNTMSSTAVANTTSYVCAVNAHTTSATSGSTICSSTTTYLTYSNRPKYTFGYTSSVPTTIIWSPVTDLYTNSGATVAYTGGAATSLWSKPSSDITYTATATSAIGCTSSGSSTVTINHVPAPSGNAAQSICFAGTVANLLATGTVIKWYDAATGGNLLLSTTPLTNGGIYYASQTVGGCESTGRFEVTTTINTTAAPTGNAVQVFLNAATVADLTALGNDIKWYSAASGGNLLLSTDLLIDGQTYYASQTLNGCESQGRFGVTVIIILIKTVNLHLYLEGLFNSVTKQMNEAMDGNTGLPQWGYGIADRIQIDLFEENPPYAPIGVSISGIDLATNGLASFQVSPTWSGNYYIRVRNRNHLETWSAVAVPFNTTNVDYNFKTGLLQAYGSDPQVMVSSNPSIYAFHLGDLDQGGWIDAIDFNMFEPDITAGSVGFYSSDFDGSGWVDAIDFNMFEPRLTVGNSTEYPGKK